MSSKWKILNNPPVVIAIFQIKYEKPSDFNFSDFIKNDKHIKEKYPKRKDNYHSAIGVQGTPAPGISLVKAKADTHLNRFLYSSDDLSQKLIIEENSIIYIFEGNYNNWDHFKKDGMESLVLLSEQLMKCKITRTSLRFINKFKFEEFNNPLDYFTTAISIDSDTKLNYPVSDYSYRFSQNVPNTNIKTIVNHSLVKIDQTFDYFFDIDVLDHEEIDFNLEKIDIKLELIRDIKNTIFFETLKEKTLDLCN